MILRVALVQTFPHRPPCKSWRQRRNRHWLPHTLSGGPLHLPSSFDTPPGIGLTAKAATGGGIHGRSHKWRKGPVEPRQQYRDQPEPRLWCHQEPHAREAVASASPVQGPAERAPPMSKPTYRSANDDSNLVPNSVDPRIPHEGCIAAFGRFLIWRRRAETSKIGKTWTSPPGAAYELQCKPV